MSNPSRLLMWVVLLTLAVLSGCADSISRTDLLERIEDGTAPPVIDVRSASEYEESHVPGAIHIQFYSLVSGLDQIPERRRDDEPLVLYCEHGPRAGLARAQLWLAGIGPVLFMEGHMTAWKHDELPVEEGASLEEPAGASEPALTLKDGYDSSRARA